MSEKRLTIVDLQVRKTRGEKITMVTAYDATFAALFDKAGIDVLLVGDSLGMVVQGHANTLPVTLDQMVYHTAAVSRGVKRAHVVGDLPFMSYQVSSEKALEAAGRLMQEGGAHAVKLEGGGEMSDTVERIVNAGIPVMGHIGLTPQSVHQLGGFRVQGRDTAAARKLIADARILANSGCYALVLEGIPVELAYEITTAIHIPTIGIGAGAHCDGQVLVSYDLLGLNPHFKPKFVKTYTDLHAQATAAVQEFMLDVQNGTFPASEHSYEGGPTLRLVRSNLALAREQNNEDHEDDNDRIYGVPV